MNDKLVHNIKNRKAELEQRLQEAWQKAQTSKAQYDELTELLNTDLPDDAKQEVERLRQSKLAENAIAVEKVRNLLARLQVHEELLAALGEVSDGGAERG